MAAIASSKEAGKILMSFKLNPKNAMQVKQSIAALADPKFNPDGLGSVVAHGKAGFSINVCDAKFHPKSAGRLFLDSSGLIDFHCDDTVLGLINLNRILEYNSADDDTITVINVLGYGYLSFIFEGAAASQEVKVDMVVAPYPRFPNVDICCSIVVRYEVLLWILRITSPPRMVKMKVSTETVRLDVNTKNFVHLEKDENYQTVTCGEYEVEFELKNLEALNKAVGIKGDEFKAEEAITMMELENIEALNKASGMRPYFDLRIGTDLRHMTIKFELQDVGDLVFFQTIADKQ